MTDKNSLRKLPAGVQKNGGGLRIVFQLNGQTKREQVCKTATESDIRQAESIRKEVLGLIKAGNFGQSQYLEFFSKVKQNDTAGYSNVVKQWLLQLKKDEIRGVLAHSTVNLYCNLVKRSVAHFKNQSVLHITGEDLENFELELLQTKKPNGKNLSRKYVSDSVSVAGMVLEYSRKRGRISVNPIVNMRRTRKNFKPNKSVENLFNTAQVNRYASVARNIGYPQLGNLMQFLYHTGLRLSEAFALTWEDYDEQENTISINKSVVMGVYSQTKTHLSTRTLILDELAVRALEAQKPLTLKNKAPTKIQISRYGEIDEREVQFIFLSDTTGKPFSSNHSYRKQWINIQNDPMVEKLPKKSLMDLRHSYATNQIIGGTELMYLAQMLGHSTINTMYKHYAKIINQRNDRTQRKQMNHGIITAMNIK